MLFLLEMVQKLVAENANIKSDKVIEQNDDLGVPQLMSKKKYQFTLYFWFSFT